ncbi:MAG TPA: ABC transporter substrate-binding protein [Rhabdaerophilum sp.]|nr:ABC transporter substrate-binding protein [Rhabdaerophilum sp.]
MNLTKRSLILAGAGLALVASLGASLAQETVKIVGVVELSGAGATAGTNYKNGAQLAVDEINAAGGILGKKIEFVVYDTQTNPGNTRAAVQRGVDEGAFAIFGPVFSGPIGASMQIAQKAGVPQIVGGEAAGLTKQGVNTLFRTSLNQADAMPKLAEYFKTDVSAKSVAVVWVNNDFGKGGRDAIIPELQKRGIKIAADIATESAQADFAADAIKVKASNADAVFVYLNEEESARFLRAIKQQGYDKPIVGETTLLGAKVIELAGPAAEGAKGHVGLSVDASKPTFKDFGQKFQAKFNYKSDHNGIKGYSGMYMLKTVVERVGKFDKEAFLKAAHGAVIKVKDVPGILIDSKWDDKGDVDRESFLAEVKGGKQVITGVLPPINKF